MCLLCLPDRNQVLETEFSSPKADQFHNRLSIIHFPAQRKLRLAEIKFCLHPKKENRMEGEPRTVLFVLSVSARVLSGYCGFLPQSKNMWGKLWTVLQLNSLPVGESVYGCFSFL